KKSRLHSSKGMSQKVLAKNGTRIYVDMLHDSIAARFDESKSDFVNQLKRMVRTMYSLIIKKGFKVYINSSEHLEPAELNLLTPTDWGKSNARLVRPYMFNATINNVDIKLVVGFYRKLATQSEIEAENGVSRSRENAGWTIICND